MGAGCCRAHILPGQHAGAPPPRPAWGPAWGTTAPDHSIASLRPGDKFHFHREPFIRQHLVVPDKPFSAIGANGVHNKAFTSDGGELTIRPASRRALPSLSTPEPSPAPAPAPVPPPRKKRRARPAQPLGQPHGLQGLPGDAPPQPPSRTRAGSRQRDGDDDAERDPSDSILSPANTMELLQRMAKVDARAGGRRPGPAWRSMDSLDAVELRGRSLPGRGTASTTTASRFSTASSQQGYLTQSTEALDGPRSLDLNLDREGVVGVAAFTLQSWDERGSSSASAATRPWSPPLSTSAALLSPRQWRPVSPLSAGRAGRASPQQTQTATTRAMSDFIRDSYAARSDGADAVVPSEQEAAAVADTAEAEAGGTKALPEQKTLDSPEGRAAEGHPVGQPVIELEGLDSVAPDARRGRSAAASDVTPVSASTPSPSKSAGLLDVAAADGRPASAASSTTESLGELENDILHMLSSSGPASARADAADAEESDRDQDRDEGAGEAESNNNGPVLQKHRPTALDSAPLSA